MRTRIPWITAVALFTVTFCQSASAQTHASLSDSVLSMAIYEPMAAHMTVVSTEWLRSDGTFVVLSSEIGPDLGNLEVLTLPEAGTSGSWSYSSTGPSTGTLVLTTQGLQSTTYALSFTSASGGGTSMSGSFGTITGTFTLRPSGYGTGPSNLSVLTSVGPGGSGASSQGAGGPATIGFVISGSTARYVLVRAVGPSLGALGVQATASGLGLIVVNPAGTLLGTGVDWSVASNGTTVFQNLFSTFGAFPLMPSSGESCMVLSLNPGAYTVQATASGGGNALIEVYFLP